jgi:TRAP-type C4-dicarboxylate transport system substrate-binding protein
MLSITFAVFFALLTNQAHGAVLKIATLSPEGSSWMQKMRKGAGEVAQKTNNRVRFKFYPGGVMGSDKAVLRKIRIGQLQGGAVMAGSMTSYFPDIHIYALPLKFRSLKEVDYVRARMDRLIIDGLDKGGFVTFGLAEGGFAYVMSKAPIRTIGDLQRQKVWIPENDSTALETVRTFGISPIPLATADVRAALQTGLINTVTTSPIAAIALQWHTQVDYILDIPLLYIYGLLAVDRKAFSRISPGDQSLVRDVMGRVFGEIDRQNRENNVKAREALRKQGIQSVKPTGEALDELYSKGSEVWKRLVETGRLSPDLTSALEDYLDDHRTKRVNAFE